MRECGAVDENESSLKWEREELNNTCSCLKCGETPTRKKMMKKNQWGEKREKQPSTRQNDNEYSAEIKLKQIYALAPAAASLVFAGS